MRATSFERDVTTDAVDYLQRTGWDPLWLAGQGGRTTSTAELRRSIQITGIGCLRKPGPPGDGEAVRYENPNPTITFPTEGVIVGLSGYKIPLVFAVEGVGQTATFHLGVWSPQGESAPPAVLESRLALLSTLLRGAYPVLDATPSECGPADLSLGGLALGVPSPSLPDPLDGGLALDRLIRALSGSRWQAVILAEPVDDSVVATIRYEIINELRAARNYVEPGRPPTPLAEHYAQLLSAQLTALTEAQGSGAWRVAAYLSGDADGYYRLASSWRAIFSGIRSLPEPVRVFDGPPTLELAQQWSLPDAGGAQGPGHFQHPFGCQTLLTSAQLAAYVHLPRLEGPGFGVRIVPSFDVVPRVPVVDGTSAQAALSIGTVIHRTHDTELTYTVAPRALTRHALVAGITGSGKTNTIFHLLRQAAAGGLPFLVVEPAKKEYRALIEDPSLVGVLVFTLGDERVSPFRLNPFEVVSGTTVAEHVDLLRAVFSASFGMWTPLPQVLDRCLQEIYVDRGWDLASNRNARLGEGDDQSDSFPTMTDIVAKVRDVVPRLGYEERVGDDILAALITRLDSLRSGARGRMLDCRRSLPLDEILSGPVILELESLGDDDDKAFLMGLLFTRIVEYRRAEGQTDGLRHVLVIEEAHRLLSQVGPRQSEGEADPRGKAVETFSNLLAEIRAYGQGVIVADQVPVRLAPAVMKNTGLKIAHRVVSAEDRASLAGAMAMDEDQSRGLTVLETGEAAVLGDRDDAPLLVRVPLSKDTRQGSIPTDDLVVKRMTAWLSATKLSSLLQPSSFCEETCASRELCSSARGLLENPLIQQTVARVIQSMIEDANSLDRMWPDMVEVTRARRDPTHDEAQLFHSLAAHAATWWADRRGAQGHWTYRDTADLATRLRSVLTAKAAAVNDGDGAARESFRELAMMLHARSFPPYPECERICDQLPSVCLYRSAVADLIASRQLQEKWADADVYDGASDDQERRWSVSMDAGFAVIEWPPSDWSVELSAPVGNAGARASLCFAQQMLADKESPPNVREILRKLLVEASGAQ